MQTSDQGGLVGELERTASRGESVETYELTRTGIATNPSHSDHLISLKRIPKYIKVLEIQRSPRTFAKIQAQVRKLPELIICRTNV